MLKYLLYITLFILSQGCVKKPEQMVGPTIGTLDIIADENIKYIVEQEENIFERTYKYANVNITYLPEYDMFNLFLADSVRTIMTTRPLTEEEIKYFDQHKQSHPRQFAFATSALAFITHKNPKDTAVTYEEMISMFKDSTKGKNFVIENAKSGITREILRLTGDSTLSSHFYALNSKQEVFDYVLVHQDAIGIVDWSDISDSDSSNASKMLNSINLLAISRPVDSIQAGFIRPYQYNLQDRKYPFTRDLYFISNTGKSDVGIGFASFITGEIGQKIILKSGLLPKYQTERVLELNTSKDIKVIK